jgi:hypothetical protein
MTGGPAKLSAQSIQHGTQPWSQYSPTLKRGTTGFALDFIKISQLPGRKLLMPNRCSK